MVDLTDPSPWIMTNFERVATYSTLIAVFVAAVSDWLRARKRKALRP